ncbi:MAG: hypothetical protein IKW39_00235 [Alphaproteobacteria bacterium]|nr:hypothetical protein [Alphaproteobacteria bacterium]
MKEKIFIIVLSMMLFAVQGYAQRAGVRENRSRTEQRHNSSHNRVTPPQAQRNSSYTRENPRQQSTAPSRDAYQQRSVERRYENNAPGGRSSISQPPPRSQRSDTHINNYGMHRPIYGHNIHHHHYHYKCVFDRWDWYIWGTYHNRFIRHSYYHDRYFDSLLGYYLWGALDNPTRIIIGNFSIKYKNYGLKVSYGDKHTYLDLYCNQKVTYKVGNTYIEITTNYGHANVYIYDEYGNSASYNI